MWRRRRWVSSWRRWAKERADMRTLRESFVLVVVVVVGASSLLDASEGFGAEEESIEISP